jgi:hypothetical protein
LRIVIVIIVVSQPTISTDQPYFPSTGKLTKHRYARHRPSPRVTSQRWEAGYLGSIDHRRMSLHRLSSCSSHGPFYRSSTAMAVPLRVSFREHRNYSGMTMNPRFKTSSSIDKNGAISFCSSALGREALRDGPADTASASTNVSGFPFASLLISRTLISVDM